MNQPLERISWKQADSMLQAVKSGLAKELASALKPVANYLKDKVPLFLARYPYGELLVEDGQMRTPSATASDDLKREFEAETSYCCIPLTLVTGKSVEVFTYGLHKRIISLRVLGPGEPFGVFEVLDALINHPSTGAQEKPPWSVSSGARSVHLIAAIDESNLQERMSTCLGVEPEDLDWDSFKKDSWPLIRTVAHKQELDWHTEVLVFPKRWLIPDSDNPRYHEVHRVLFKCGWSQSESLRNASLSEADLAERISVAIKGKKSINLDSFDAFLAVRHLLATAQGQAVAFEPVISGNGRLEMGPFLACQDFLLTCSDEADRRPIFTKYFPIILQPCHITVSDEAAFYSFSRPSALAVIPRVQVGAKGAGLRSWTDFLRATERLLKRIKSDQPRLLGSLKWDDLTLYGDFSDFPSGESRRRKRKEVGKDFLLPANFGQLQVNFKHPFFTACVKIVRS